jgi:uncharacterized alpha-E superfamily protein
MLSRVAESLYWMSRYMERSDGIIRLLKVNYASSQEALVLSANGNSRSALQHTVSDKENATSIINNIIRARENARSAQDHISKELWQCLNEFYHYIRKENLSELLELEDPITVLDSLTKHCVMYYGTVDMTMIRGEGYSFMNIGKYLERSFQVADILATSYNQNELPEESKKIVEYIVLNGNYPRSIVYSINRLHRYFERLRSEKNTEAFNKLNFMIGELHSRVRYSTADTIMRQGLHVYLSRIREDLYNIGNALNHHYFSHTL